MIQRRTSPAGRYWLLFLLLPAMVLPGCKREYERRLDLQVKELQKGSDFNVLTQKVRFNFPSVPVTLFLPPDLAVVDATADPRRSKLTIAAPLAENIVSDMVAYEGKVADSDKGEQHYYLYVGSVKLEEGGIDDMMVFFNNVRTAFRSLPALEEVQVVKPDGLTVACRKCRATLPQVFYYKKPKGGGDDYPQMDGLLEIWDRKIEPAHKHLVMVWRVPAQLKDSIDFDKKARLVAGGIEVSAK